MNRWNGAKSPILGSPVDKGMAEATTLTIFQTVSVRLSEKGCGRRSEREFGRYTKARMGRKAPFWWPVRLLIAGTSETFQTVSVGNPVNRGHSSPLKLGASCQAKVHHHLLTDLYLAVIVEPKRKEG